VTELDLSNDAKARLAELQALSDRAENGDKAARWELRKAVRASSSEVVRQASELARRGQWALIKTAAAGNPLMEESLLARLDIMRVEIAGKDASPLELLLAERIVALWILAELLELLNGAQLTNLPKDQRIPHSYLKFYLGWQEQAHRRFLSAIRELARVRRLQSGVPSSHTNVQINL
jgi:hypothetical protein